MSDLKTIETLNSEMYSLVETIESDEIPFVTASPNIWIRGEEVLLWPPDSANVGRTNPIEPQPDWIPYKCKILKRNICNFTTIFHASRIFHGSQELKKLSSINDFVCSLMPCH